MYSITQIIFSTRQNMTTEMFTLFSLKPLLSQMDKRSRLRKMFISVNSTSMLPPWLVLQVFAIFPVNQILIPTDSPYLVPDFHECPSEEVFLVV